MRKFWRKTSTPTYSIGIDFGTTVSRIAYIRNKIIQDKDIENPPPPDYCPIRSLVSVRPGERGYEWNQGDPVAYEGSDVFREFKLHMESMSTIKSGATFGGLRIRPEILAARVIFALRTAAANRLKGEEFREIPRVTMTIPAEWNLIGRKATIKAAQIAGFNEVNLVEEPVAAFLAASKYRQSGPEDLGENILIFDCGGGTLDVAIIQRRSSKWPIVIGRAMEDREIAGEFIDRLLAHRALSVFAIQWDDLNEISQNHLLEAVRAMKHNLNPTKLTQPQSGRATYVRQSAFKEGDEPGLQALGLVAAPSEKALVLKSKDGTTLREFDDDELILTLSDLNSCLAPLKPKIEKCIRNTLEQANLTSSVKRRDISAIIMTGGSSYLRYFQAIIRSFFSNIRENIVIYEPDSAIAQGAALYQHYIDIDDPHFSPTLSLDTYLKYKDAQDLRTRELAMVKDRIELPHSPLPWPSIPVASKDARIEWHIYQRRSFSRKESVVESISFDRTKRMEVLYLDYQIDANGILKDLRPKLLRGKKTIEVTSSMTYDWDSENAAQLADKFEVYKDLGGEQ